MKILVYSSASTFGGHEIISIKGIEALLEAGHRLDLVCSSANTAFIEALAPLKQRHAALLQMHLRRYHMRSLQIVRSWSGWGTLLALWCLVRRLDPDRVLVLQGDIEQGSEILLPARLAGVRAISYIPMVMCGRDRGIRFARLRDALSRPVYSLASRFIVIAPYFRQQALARGATDVRVVSNCVDDDFFDRPIRRAAIRTALGVREEERLSGYVGRIAYGQKGLDRLVDLVRTHKAHFAQNRLLVVGDGPDSARLESDLKAHDLQDCVIRQGWNDDRIGYFDAMDVFLCVSRFEGVPLTILEALSRGVPVIAPPLPALDTSLPIDFCGSPFVVDDYAARVAAKPRRHVTDGLNATASVDGLRRTAFAVSFVEAVVGA